MEFVVSAMRQNPELAVFLTVAVGFLIGHLKFGSFSPGIVVGCLFAGVIIGQLDIEVPSILKTVFFSLFLFTTGYKIGPQFFRGLKRDTLPQVVLTIVLCVGCLLTAFMLSKALGYDAGTAAGLLAGAFSESTVIGTAGEAIKGLNVSDQEKTALINNIPVAYAVTYLMGTAVLVWYIPNIGPKLMGIDLRQEVARLSREESGPAASQEGAISAARPFDVRAYRVTNPTFFNRTIKDLEALPKDIRAYIIRVRSNGQITESAPGIIIREDDIVAVIARHDVHAARGDVIGPEVSDQALLDMPIEALDVVITNRDLEGRTLAELAAMDVARAVFLARFTRAGLAMPTSPDTTIDRGDVLRLIGRITEVERVAKLLGYSDRATTATDMVFVGTGIFIGGLIGLISVQVGNVPLTLSVGGGVLVLGLVFGWLRSTYPYFGRIPEPAIWIFDTLGLCMFISVVGLSAGPSFLSGLQTTGFSLVLVGLVSSLTPHTLAILFGRYVLKMNPLIVLGACAGAGTITAALRALQDKAQTNYPALGYTVPYAIGNILLTAWGPVLVALMTL
jgi:putative transport protein